MFNTRIEELAEKLNSNEISPSEGSDLVDEMHKCTYKLGYCVVSLARTLYYSRAHTVIFSVMVFFEAADGTFPTF